MKLIQTLTFLLSIFFAVFCRNFKFRFTFNIPLMWREILQTVESIKRRSKVQEKNMSCERTLYFDQLELDYGLFTSLLKIIVACDFFSSSFKYKSGILPLLIK